MEEEVATKDSNHGKTADKLQQHYTSDNAKETTEEHNIKKHFSHLIIKPHPGESENVETNGTENMETMGLIKPAVLINYKRLYDECKWNLEEQTERFQKRVISLTNKHNELLHMCKCSKMDYEKLTAEYNVLQVKFDE